MGGAVFLDRSGCHGCTVGGHQHGRKHRDAAFVTIELFLTYFWEFTDHVGLRVTKLQRLEPNLRQPSRADHLLEPSTSAVYIFSRPQRTCQYPSSLRNSDNSPPFIVQKVDMPSSSSAQLAVPATPAPAPPEQQDIAAVGAQPAADPVALEAAAILTQMAHPVRS